jgi:DHH subfamily 1 protein
MLTPILNNTEFVELMKAIQQSKRIVVCAHRGPDGDAVGSSLGWAEYLKSLGKQVTVVLPNPFPDFLRWLPNSHLIHFYARHEAAATQIINEADLIFCLDFNGLSRLQEMEGAVARAKADRILIDHHLNPDRNVAKLVISHPQMSSTSELVFRLILQLGGFEDMTQSMATCIYTGMMTDTGGFTYNSNDPAIYEIISMLLTKNIDKDKIYRNVFNVYSADRIRLTGYILYEKLNFYANNRASVFTLTRDEMKRFNFIRGDAEGLVNMPLQVKGMRLSISLREDTERDVIRVSLRSVDDFPCNKMAAEFFNGGGHLNASGGELPFPLSEAIKTAERAIEAYENLL